MHMPSDDVISSLYGRYIIQGFLGSVSDSWQHKRALGAAANGWLGCCGSWKKSMRQLPFEIVCRYC